MKTLTTLKRSEQGQAGVELTAVLPVIAIIIIGLVAAVQQRYQHLALITITNDCVTMAAQRSAHALSDHRSAEAAMEAARLTASAFDVQPGKGLSMGGDSICSTTLIPEGPGGYTVQYEFRLPMQPYKSDWVREP